MFSGAGGGGDDADENHRAPGDSLPFPSLLPGTFFVGVEGRSAFSSFWVLVFIPSALKFRVVPCAPLTRLTLSTERALAALGTSALGISLVIFI